MNRSIAPLGACALVAGLSITTMSCASSGNEASNGLQTPSGLPAPAASEPPGEESDSATGYPALATDIAATSYPPPKLTDEAVGATQATEAEAKAGTAAAVGGVTPLEATDMTSYTHPVLGLSFEYPAALGSVETLMRSGSDNGFAWSLEFSDFDALSFHGRSHDFSEGRDGMSEDTLGVSKDDVGSYRWRTVMSPTGSEIEPDDVLEVDGREIVLLRIPAWAGRGQIEAGPRAALGNLIGAQFPGYIVMAEDTERLPDATLRAILASIRVEEPTESASR